MYSIDSNLSDCFCENNNNIGDVSKFAMSFSSGNLTGSRRKNSASAGMPRKLEIRKEEVMAIRTRFPNKIPVIVQKYWKENQLPQLDKSKFLVPQDITMSQFQTIIRNRMRMNQNQALYLLVNERSMLSLSLTLGEIYTDHAGPNGFLYITYASQEVFGYCGEYLDKLRSEEDLEAIGDSLKDVSVEDTHTMTSSKDTFREESHLRLSQNATTDSSLTVSIFS